MRVVCGTIHVSCRRIEKDTRGIEIENREKSSWVANYREPLNKKKRAKSSRTGQRTYCRAQERRKKGKPRSEVRRQEAEGRGQQSYPDDYGF